MNTEKTIIRNSIRTPDGTELISRHRHDFVSYTDANGKEYAVDGGREYLRRCYTDNDFEDTSLYLEDMTIEEAAQHVTWGTRGKDGRRPVKFVAVADMDFDHLIAVLRTQKRISLSTKAVMKAELTKRCREKMESYVPENYEGRFIPVYEWLDITEDDFTFLTELLTGSSGNFLETNLS